jgi:hypothetical protein
MEGGEERKGELPVKGHPSAVLEIDPIVETSGTAEVERGEGGCKRGEWERIEEEGKMRPGE